MIILNEIQKAKIDQHTLDVYPNEACGVVTVDDYIPVENTAPEPKGAFILNKEAFNDIKKTHNVVAIYHSHTREVDVNYGHLNNYDPRTPSPRDFKSCNALGIPFLISATDGEIVMDCIEYPGDRDNDLCGRPFMFYINDCYTVVKDYYWQKYQIKLPLPPDSFDWIHHQGVPEYLYDQHFENFGFYEVRPDDVEEGDVVIMSFIGTANHVGIVLKDFRVLHHMVNQPSCIMPLIRFQSYIHRYVRHKDKPKQDKVN